MTAFEQVVAQTQSGVYNLAYSVLGNHEEAQDATQEVYVRVWRALANYRGEARFTTWLYRVALNSSLNRRRQLKPALGVIDDERVLEHLVATSGDPMAATIEHERNRALWGMVGRLPAKYRLVIELFYRRQMTYDEMADVLAIPLGTVKAQLNRARRALARLLQGGQEGRNAM